MKSLFTVTELLLLTLAASARRNAPPGLTVSAPAPKGVPLVLPVSDCTRPPLMTRPPLPVPPEPASCNVPRPNLLSAPV